MYSILFLTLLSALRDSFRRRAALQLELIAVRHQLATMTRISRRPSLRPTDRLLWVLLSRFLPNWREMLVIVKPETVIGWHRKGFRLYWTWKSRRRGGGRPPIPRDVRDLIRRMSRENPLWGAVPSIYSIVPPNDGSALRHGHHFEPVDFVIDHGRGHHDAYSAGSCQRTYARACGCRQRPRCHREELIESEPGWSGREAFVTMMQTADLGQGNNRSGPGRLNGSSIRGVLAERQVGP